ncbi:BatD family protein [Cupriavidus alkaliphilus]|uniref:BatD family protein n=1 Tax=Cupriavidus alkaliphilus TaxID=942866 RepID=UPI000DC285AB|nr:BatD family protein [Cupriavidus alkaliphilus]RAS01247.1 oxygen tolerance protein BatD [Cupriavidus alkaliphilus]
MPPRAWLRRAAPLVLLLAAWLWPWLARAAAGPIVRVEVGARQPVLVGQQVGIDITILAPNYFLSAPEFPPLEVPGAVVTLPDARAVNSTETIDGVAYAGIRKTYAFTAEQDGEFPLPAATIQVTYAGDDGAPREGSVTLPVTTIRAGTGVTSRAAAGAASGRRLLPVARLSVTQALDHDPDHGVVRLQAGDALVRTVTTFAPRTQAMMIVPPHAAAPRGVRMFRADARLSDQARDAPGPGGTRVDTLTYVFERPGTYTLPAVTADWVDPATRQPASSEAPAVKVEVAAARKGGALAPGGPPAGALPGEGGLPWRTLLWAAGALLGAAALALLWRRLRPRLARLQQRRAERRRARAEGADARLAATLRACRAGDAAAASQALGGWTRAAHGTMPAAWAEAAGDAALADAVTGLQRHLYGAAPAPSAWDGNPLAQALGRHARPTPPRRHRTPPALPPLNP